MGIEFIGIDGHRSLRHVEWSPGPLNVVIGPNASGKSNLLKALHILSATANNRLSDCLHEQGGIREVVWDRTDRDIAFRLTLAGNEPSEWSARYNLTLQRYGEHTAYKITREHFFGAAGTSEPIIYERSDNTVRTQGLSPDTTRMLRGLTEKQEALIASVRLPFITEDLLLSTRSSIASWQVLDGFHTDFGSRVRSAVVSRVDERLDRDGQNLANVLHTLYENDDEFREEIDSYMSAAFGRDYKGLAFPPGGQNQIQLAVRWESLSTPQAASDLPDGILRYLFLITAFSSPRLPSLIAIDEPETGLHPGMMRLVAECADAATLRTQVILTTHSDAFLEGFRKDRLPTITVAESHDGETALRIVDADLLSRWIPEFSLGELYRSRELEQMPEARRLTV